MSSLNEQAKQLIVDMTSWMESASRLQAAALMLEMDKQLSFVSKTSLEVLRHEYARDLNLAQMSFEQHLHDHILGISRRDDPLLNGDDWTDYVIPLLISPNDNDAVLETVRTALAKVRRAEPPF